jgi:hypothetical protein
MNRLISPGARRCASQARRNKTAGDDQWIAAVDAVDDFAGHLVDPITGNAWVNARFRRPVGVEFIDHW